MVYPSSLHDLHCREIEGHVIKCRHKHAKGEEKEESRKAQSDDPMYGLFVGHVTTLGKKTGDKDRHVAGIHKSVEQKLDKKLV
jgi:hypothetical protein